MSSTILQWAYLHLCQFHHGGWCPEGRTAEDGTIAPRYQLTETSTKDYLDNTDLNVRESDATLILVDRLPVNTRGTLLTIEFAKSYGRPFLTVPLLVEGDSLAQGVV